MVANLFKIISLIILIILIIIGGLVIFDWLGLVSLRREFAPILRLVGMNSPTANGEGVAENIGDSLAASRLRQQLESLEFSRQKLEEQEQKIQQRSQELNERELALTRAEEQLQQQLNSLEERENLYSVRRSKIEQIARNFNGMPPAQAVAQMSQMDALLVVDILRAAERLAAQENKDSLVSYWLSQMSAQKGAELNKLLVEKP